MIKISNLRIGAAVGATVVAALMAGCSGIKTYPNDLPRNVEVRTKTSSDSMFRRLKASVNIYGIKPGCKYDYLGTLALDNGKLDMGIPTGGPVNLEFRFTDSAVLGGSSSSTSQDIFFTPRAGFRYRIEASYVDNLYYVGATEYAPGRKQGRELDSQRPQGC